MPSRNQPYSLRFVIIVAALLALVAGGFWAAVAPQGTAAPGAPQLTSTPPCPPPGPPCGPTILPPGYPQYLPALVQNPPPTVTPTPTATPVPVAIFVGERNAWDGEGFIVVDTSFQVGTHTRREFDRMVDDDIIRSDNRHWYDPNPEGWEEEQWFEHYILSTGYLHSVTGADPDPRFMWSFPWFLPYDWTFRAGQDFLIDGARFAVAGPLQGATSYGLPVHYWRLVNREPVLFWQEGDLTQWVLAGELELHYDAGATRLLLYSDVLRRLYYTGQPIGYSVRYLDWLTASNAFPQPYRAEPAVREQAGATGVDLTGFGNLSGLAAPGLSIPPESLKNRP